MTVQSIVPPYVHVAEATSTDTAGELHPDEAVIVAQAVEARRAEFALGRTLAREALASLGGPAVSILVGPSREPVWPLGFVGSITHCDGYAAAAVATDAVVRAIGIDAEPKLPLPSEILELIARPEEISRFEAIGAHADRLLFSAKESLYKAWFPLTGRWLDFLDVVVTFSPDGSASGTFVAVLVSDVVSGVDAPRTFDGRYRAAGEHVLTSVVVPALGDSPATDTSGISD